MSKAGARPSAGQILPFRESLMAMVGISLVNMLGALDQTVVSTALPSIVSELKGFDYYRLDCYFLPFGVCGHRTYLWPPG